MNEGSSHVGKCYANDHQYEGNNLLRGMSLPCSQLNAYDWMN